MVMSARSGLLLPRDPLQVLCRYGEESTQLFDALFRHVAGSVAGDGLVQKFLGLLVVGFGDVQSVFQRGLMFQR